MNNERSAFFKAMMTGLFIGIIDTVILLAYNIGYRNETGYIPSEIVNVSSLIFAVNILLTVIGILYYLFIRYIRGADIIYEILILAGTAWLTIKAFSAVRFGDAHLDKGWHGLAGGIVLVLGLSSACMPFFYKSQKFQDAVI